MDYGHLWNFSSLEIPIGKVKLELVQILSEPFHKGSKYIKWLESEQWVPRWAIGNTRDATNTI